VKSCRSWLSYCFFWFSGVESGEEKRETEKGGVRKGKIKEKKAPKLQSFRKAFKTKLPLTLQYGSFSGLGGGFSSLDEQS